MARTVAIGHQDFKQVIENNYFYIDKTDFIRKLSKESIFSDLNNLKVVTSISDEYGTAFGFTEAEVFAALEEYGLRNAVLKACDACYEKSESMK